MFLYCWFTWEDNVSRGTCVKSVVITGRKRFFIIMKYLELKDYSVTEDAFALIYDEDLDLLKTSPQPSQSELPRFYESENYISHTSNKRSLFEMVYHWVREFAVKSKVNLINEKQPKGNLLDIGAGTGDFLNAAKLDGWLINGVEPNSNARNLAVEKGLVINETTSALQANSFDVITMWHVFEHVPNYDEQILELKRLLKPSGIIIIAVPNYKSYDAKHYKEYWAAYDVPRHLWHFSKISIEKIFSVHDLVLKEVKPMKFDSYYVSLLSEKYKTGKMNFLKAFAIGLKSNLDAIKTSEFSSHIYVIERA